MSKKIGVFFSGGGNALEVEYDKDTGTMHGLLVNSKKRTHSRHTMPFDKDKTESENAETFRDFINENIISEGMKNER